MREPVLKLENVWAQNLQGISVAIPHRSLTVVTGPSGSGKSSLVFGAIQAQAWRTLGRGLLEGRAEANQVPADPNIARASGLLFPISLRSTNRFRSARQTVSTVSGLDHFLLELFYQFGRLGCSQCGRELQSFRQSEVLRAINEHFGPSLLEVSVKISDRMDTGRQYMQEGFSRVRFHGEALPLDSLPEGALSDRNVELIIDVIATESDARQVRMLTALRLGFGIGEGLIVVRALSSDGGVQRQTSYSLQPFCAVCGRSEPPLHRSELRIRGQQADPFRMNRLRLGHSNYYELLQGDISAVLSWRESVEELLGVMGVGGRLLLSELSARLEAMREMGLGYLGLQRLVRTLSLGESCRLELVRELGSPISGAMYLFDEPTSGLHPKNSEDLLRLMHRLRQRGSTIIVVEHDAQVIGQADYLIELGPGGGVQGGRVVSAGPRKNIPEADREEVIEGTKHPGGLEQAKMLRFRGVRKHNILDLSVDIPLCQLVVVCGVSGSGKSTLVFDVLVPELRRGCQARLGGENGEKEVVPGSDSVQAVIAVQERGVFVDRRSTVATVSGIAPLVREFFSMLPEAKILGLSANHFSFRAARGRCALCQGTGIERLSNVRLDLAPPCKRCHGTRLNEQSLRVRYRGKNLAEWYEQTVEEWFEAFSRHPRIAKVLAKLQEFRLGYLRLSQSAPTLSAGEQQRLRIIAELSLRHSVEGLVFAFEEPTRGLSVVEISELVRQFRSLVAQGATIVVTEHNLQMLRAADFVLELGPGAGRDGGKLIASGTVEQIRNDAQSVMKAYLCDRKRAQ